MDYGEEKDYISIKTSKANGSCVKILRSSPLNQAVKPLVSQA
jgi:hypothetical protein